MFQMYLYKPMISKILEYFYQQQFDMLADENGKHDQVKVHIKRVLDLEVTALLQAHIVSMQRYTIHAHVGLPGKMYNVAFNNIGRASCSCPSFYYRHLHTSGYCKHIIALAMALENPQVAKMHAIEQYTHE